MMAKRGDDLRFDLTLNLLKAIWGGEEKIEIYHLETCQICDGRGEQKRGLGSWFRGGLPAICNTCNGSGRIEVTKSLTIMIPAGVEEGTRLRISGEGDAGEKGGASGDLYIFVSVQQDLAFQRDGINLLSEVTLSEAQAISGCQVQVNTIDGIETLTIPSQTQPGTVLTLQNRGVPVLGNPSQRGDHFVSIRVEPDAQSHPPSSKIPIEQAEYFFSSGIRKFQSQDYQGAIADLRQAIAMNPDFAVACCALGNTYFAMQDYQSAIACFDQALRIDPYLAEAYGSRGLAYYELGDKQRARDELTQSIQIAPKLAHSHYSRGQVNVALESIPQALADFETAIDLYLLVDQSQLYDSNAAEQLHRIQNHYRAGINLRRSSAKPLISQAFEANDRGDSQKALDCFAQAIQLEPAIADIYYFRSSLYRDSGNVQNALNDLSQAIQLNSRFADLYYNRGNIYFDVGNNQAAISDFNQSIKLDPYLAQGYYNLGSAYHNLGDKQAALSNIQHAAVLFQRLGDTQSYASVMEIIRTKFS